MFKMGTNDQEAAGILAGTRNEELLTQTGTVVGDLVAAELPGGEDTATVEDGRSQSKPEEKPVAKTATGTSHPSWQAAKQRKQQINPGAAFTGKKISFD